jgi:uncharacterized protein
MSDEGAMRRIRPIFTEDEAYFWTTQPGDPLRLARCDDCELFLHPRYPVCRRCFSRSIGAAPVSGYGEVYSFTVNHRAWNAEPDPTYVVAIVALDEQPGLHLLTNIVGCQAEEVRIGMRVAVAFEADGDLRIPVFEPVTE